MDLKVERELNVGAGLRGHGAGLTGHIARGIDLDGLLATNTLQQVFVVALNARLAHDIARLVRNLASGSIVIARGFLILGLELLGGNGAGIAQDMACRLAVWILALGTLGNLDARELAGMLLNIGNRGATDVRRDGMQALGALCIVLNIAKDRHVRHSKHVGKMANQNLILGKVAVGHDSK